MSVNPPKCTSNDFINFLIATYQACTCTEASRCLPSESEQIAHDSVKRLLERQPPHTEALYDEAKHLIRHDKGVLVIDDSTLDKPYSHQIEMVTRHWSGKHHRVVQGINLVSTIWTEDPELFLLISESITLKRMERIKMIISGIWFRQQKNGNSGRIV